jgi:acyl carrier protein
LTHEKISQECITILLIRKCGFFVLQKPFALTNFVFDNYTFPGVLLMSLMDDVKRILRDTLVLDNDRVEKLDTTSPLLGNIIELDSVGVVSVLTAIEEEYGIVVEDDEISADVFKTLGSLIEFLEHKIG